MLEVFSSARTHEFEAKLTALGKSQAVIEFNIDGTIITANENFLNVMGYTLAEIQGKHHRMFVTPEDRDSAAYGNSGPTSSAANIRRAEYKRIGKGGKDVWIQASYNPILDRSGKPFKVVKYATDITRHKLQNADYAGQIAAIGKSQAVIEFNMDGTILTANENFLTAMGYTLDEIQGKHHSMFVDPGRPQQRRLPAVLGRASTAATTRPPNTSASARAARKSGSKPPTTRSSTSTASPSRSSNSPPT